MSESYKQMYFIGQQIHYRCMDKEFIGVITEVVRGDIQDRYKTSEGLYIYTRHVIAVIGGTPQQSIEPIARPVQNESVVDMPSYMFTELHNTLHGMNVENWHRIKLDEALATGNKELFDELTSENYG